MSVDFPCKGFGVFERPCLLLSTLLDAGQGLLPALFLRADSHVVVCPGLGAVAVGGRNGGDGGAGGGKQCFEQLGFVTTSSHLRVHTVEADGWTGADTPEDSRPGHAEERDTEGGMEGGVVVSNPFGLGDAAVRELVEAEEGMASSGQEELEGRAGIGGGEGCWSPGEYVRCIEEYYSWHRGQPLALGDQRVFAAVSWL